MKYPKNGIYTVQHTGRHYSDAEIISEFAWTTVSTHRTLLSALKQQHELSHKYNKGNTWTDHFRVCLGLIVVQNPEKILQDIVQGLYEFDCPTDFIGVWR